jgi:glycerol-1-phosphate dehydrogenase [NAD(P)+]
VVCDGNTYQALGATVLALVPAAALAQLPAPGLKADERGVAALEAALQASGTPDILLAVGAGTVHDITRYTAHRHGLDFVSLPTAASVDGFVSTVAAMTWGGFKTTFAAVAPLAVFADLDVIQAAPARLNASGFSDLLGKVTALADWQIARLLTGEYFCQAVYDQMQDALAHAQPPLATLEGARGLTQGLLLSGLAMQQVGNSRPASGAEHHLAHFWEMEIANGPIDAYHGEKVGVGLLAALERYHRAKAALSAGAFAKRPDYPAGFLTEKYFGPACFRQVAAENAQDPLAAVTPEMLAEKSGALLQILNALPQPAQARARLEAAGCVTALPGLALETSLALSPLVRNRLTFMRVIYQFGL